jgi:hypothetical protein
MGDLKEMIRCFGSTSSKLKRAADGDEWRGDAARSGGGGSVPGGGRRPGRAGLGQKPKRLGPIARISKEDGLG